MGPVSLPVPDWKWLEVAAGRVGVVACRCNCVAVGTGCGGATGARLEPSGPLGGEEAPGGLDRNAFDWLK